MKTSLPIREQYLPFGQPNFSEEEVSAIVAVLRSHWIGMGPETLRFESELAEFLGAKHVVTVNSCTSALFLSLLAHGVGPGDEVIVPSLTWCSTANVALYLGATPVFCDVDRKSFCVTPDLIGQKLTPRTKAVIVVHMGGLAVDVDAVGAVLPAGVALVEDAAHALGSMLPGGRPVGSSGNLACFSFYANKNLSTGEGGAVALEDGAIADRLRSLRQHGLSADAWKRFTDPRALLTPTLQELGYKMNYTDLQASIGRVQLKRQAEFHTTRLAVAREYAKELGNGILGLQFQTGVLDPGHARHLIMVALPVESLRLSRDDVVLALRERNIGASIHYRPLHTMPFYSEKFPAALQNTEWLAERVFTLPVSANMTADEACDVSRHLKDILDQQQVL